MAQNEQVRVDIVADDQASKTLDQVADKVDDLEHADVEIPVDADTRDAQRGLGDVAEQADRLDGERVEIPVDADTTDAARGIADVKADADALTDADRELVIKAQIGDGKAAIKDLQAELDDLQGRAKVASDRLDNVARESPGGGRLRGQAIADLTGPLGDVSSQASDLAGVFDGLGDTLGGLGGKFGISAGAIEGALGGISFAVAGAVAAWGLWRQAQQKAREELEKTVDQQRKLADLLTEAKFSEAAQQLVDDYGKVFDAADKAKIPIEEVTRFLAGYSDELPTITQRIQDASKAQYDHGETAATATARIEQQAAAIYDQKQKVDDANESIRTQDERVRRASEALAEHADTAGALTAKEQELQRAADRTNDAFDRMSDAVNLDAEFHRFMSGIDDMQAKVASGTALASADIDGLKGDIIALAKDAKANPAEVKSTLDKIDQGDLAGVKADAERYYAQRPVVAQGTIDFTKVIFPNANQSGALLRPPGATFSVGGPITGGIPTSVVNVTQYVPRGYRGDALVQARQAARRSGGLYQRFSR